MASINCLKFAPMRFRLRTLMIVLALGPSLVAASYWMWAAPAPSPWLTEEDFPDFKPPPGWNLKLQLAVQRKIETDRKAGRYPLTNNRP